MSAIETGSSAFPVAYTEGMDFYKGMTLRDYFAAAALQGLMAHSSREYEGPFAKWAYEYADEMLRVRKQ